MQTKKMANMTPEERSKYMSNLRSKLKNNNGAFNSERAKIAIRKRWDEKKENSQPDEKTS